MGRLGFSRRHLCYKIFFKFLMGGMIIIIKRKKIFFFRHARFKIMIIKRTRLPIYITGVKLFFLRVSFFKKFYRNLNLCEDSPLKDREIDLLRNFPFRLPPIHLFLKKKTISVSEPHRTFAKGFV